MRNDGWPIARIQLSSIKREGQDDFWLPLGAAFEHQDGKGFNVILQAHPLDKKIVLRTYKEEEKVVKAKFKK